jgi:hypothetical protein
MMTPKYSAQWWEKFAARPQQETPEHDAPATAFSIYVSGEPQTAASKIKQRKSVCSETG